MMLPYALWFLAFTLLLWLAERMTRIPTEFAKPIETVTRSPITRRPVTENAATGRTYHANDALVPEVWSRQALSCLMSNTILSTLINRDDA